MNDITELWSPLVILLAAFMIGWAAEAAQTFIPRAFALSILAWLQTLPEFAVEANIAWNQKTDLMIANLTGSLRILVGLGWPMIFFVYFFSQGIKRKQWPKEIVLSDGDFAAPFFLFISVVYFLVILYLKRLSCWDSVVLTAIYCWYLWFCLKASSTEDEDHEDMPWIVKKILALPQNGKMFAVVTIFAAGGVFLYFSVDPFLHTLEKWALGFGVSTFVFVQWVAPFLSEFPEKVTAFNWARQTKKAPLAVMNMVSSNINQWTMLAAMIPIVYSLSAGEWKVVEFDSLHESELALTIAQSFLAGILLLDLKFSLFEALLIFVLWFVQFIFSATREPITIIYVIWSVIEIGKVLFIYFQERKLPRVVSVWYRWRTTGHVS